MTLKTNNGQTKQSGKLQNDIPLCGNERCRHMHVMLTTGEVLHVIGGRVVRQ